MYCDRTAAGWTGPHLEVVGSQPDVNATYMQFGHILDSLGNSYRRCILGRVKISIQLDHKRGYEEQNVNGKPCDQMLLSGYCNISRYKLCGNIRCKWDLKGYFSICCINSDFSTTFFFYLNAH